MPNYDETPNDDETPNYDETEVNFIANAGIKDIVGRGLIYNDNVAIIELVKNSKDADSSRVIVDFNDIETNQITLKNLEGELHPEIIIKDFGNGMSKTDIQSKWLNIAYSEKKGRTDKFFAGNKGVGRFSCDRLGEILTLYSRCLEGEYLRLKIDWTLFENKGVADEISSIPLYIEHISQDEFERETQTINFNSGTILKITNLRSEWSEQKLKKLIAELEKFSPSLDNGFEIFLNSNVEFEDPALAAKINKKINNGILEKLSFKTTYIKSHIDTNGEFIHTTLYYQSEEIYSYVANNPFSHLSNISIEIHYLDSISKGFFTKNIGFNPNNYGSVFLFYNGFRVSPYGNEKNDWLNLDQRKAQGTSRNLGTRDLFGRIDIKDNNNDFSIITSREGLAQNNAFYDLAASDREEKTTLRSGKKEYGFVTLIIRQLETFVVDGLDWNRLVDTRGEKKSVSYNDVDKDPERFIQKELSKEKVEQTINKIVNASFHVENFEINYKLISDIKKINKDKIDSYLKAFYNSVGDKELSQLAQQEKITVKKVIKSLQHERDIAKKEQLIAEKVADVAIKEKIKVKDKLQLENKRSSFLERLISPEKTLDALITHVIQQVSGGIEKDSRSILSAYYNDPDSVSKEELIGVIEHAVIDISTIRETANMATKANFNLKVSSVDQDLFQFLEDYVNKVAINDSRWRTKISFKNTLNSTLHMNFKPAEVCVLLVNLIDNARKAQAQNFTIECHQNLIHFIDDGKGFDLERMESADYLRKGITTDIFGTGLGLFHCARIAKSLRADLLIENNVNNGAIVKLEF